jgi:hypothetical protein
VLLKKHQPLLCLTLCQAYSKSRHKNAATNSEEQHIVKHKYFLYIYKQGRALRGDAWGVSPKCGAMLLLVTKERQGVMQEKLGPGC